MCRVLGRDRIMEKGYWARTATDTQSSHILTNIILSMNKLFLSPVYGVYSINVIGREAVSRMRFVHKIDIVNFHPTTEPWQIHVGEIQP